MAAATRDEVTFLKAEIQTVVHADHPRLDRLPSPIKEQLSRYVAARRAAGFNRDEIGPELGLSARTLDKACRRWKANEAARKVAPAPTAVSKTPVATTPASDTPAAPTAVSMTPAAPPVSKAPPDPWAAKYAGAGERSREILQRHPLPSLSPDLLEKTLWSETIVARVLGLSVTEIADLRALGWVGDHPKAPHLLIASDILDLLGVRLPLAGDTRETYVERCGRAGVTPDATYIPDGAQSAEANDQPACAPTAAEATIKAVRETVKPKRGGRTRTATKPTGHISLIFPSSVRLEGLTCEDALAVTALLAPHLEEHQ